MLNQILSLCAEARWAPAVCEPFVDMLIDVDVVASTTGSLLIPSTANGLCLQLCDMFVEQLGLVLDARPAEATLDGGNYTCRDIPPGALVRMLRPFIGAFEKTGEGGEKGWFVVCFFPMFFGGLEEGAEKWRCRGPWLRICAMLLVG